jgi:D-alanine-D-alanine ligase
VDRKELKDKKIAVLLGGKSSERDVSIRSGKAVLAALLRSGHDAVSIDVSKDLARDLIKQKIEVAYIALHGRWGEDGTVQGLLEMLSIPYTGPGVLGSATAMDKAMMKFICAAHNIPTPPYAVVYGNSKIALPLPFVVKPANEGSSFGVSIVRKAAERASAIKKALEYDKKILIEEFVEGVEITVAVINGKTLPVIGVKPKSGFYDFDAKYKKGGTDYIVPAKITKTTAKKAARIALNVYKVFDLAGCARIDMLIREDKPLVIDINTSPGMTETSLAPKAWAYTGGTFDELVEEILSGAALKI